MNIPAAAITAAGPRGSLASVRLVSLMGILVVVVKWLILGACAAAIAFSAAALRFELPTAEPTAATRVPSARLESSGTTVAESKPVTIAFKNVDFASPRLPGGALDGLTAPRTGIYAVYAGIAWPPDPDGIRVLFITKESGATQTFKAAWEGDAISDPSRRTIQTISTLVRLKAGERVLAQGYQTAAPELVLPDDPRTFLAFDYVSP